MANDQTSPVVAPRPGTTRPVFAVSTAVVAALTLGLILLSGTASAGVIVGTAWNDTIEPLPPGTTVPEGALARSEDTNGDGDVNRQELLLDLRTVVVGGLAQLDAVSLVSRDSSTSPDVTQS